ncbi:MAG TPA: peptide ABC transporter substrate-binding protein, partial [Candidatus Limnocylindria bacterium]|nr:peptide ABC transporter substrate-binding protein [Candidatus Limnocylindria bacterium]
APGTTTASPSGAASDVDPNGELTLNTGTEPHTIDPQKSSFVDEIGQAAMVFEGLMTFDSQTTKTIPAAAADQPKWDASKLTYTYTMRDGLKYSDGTPLTAKNFEYAFKRGCDPTQAGDYAFVLYVIVGCEEWNTADTKKATPAELDALKAKVGIKATDDKTLVFTLKEPASYFVAISALWIGWPVRESDVTKGGDKWTEPATYIGNGPFKLVEWKHNEKLVYEPNPNWRKGTVKIKKLTFVMIQEANVAFAAYRNNELDMTSVTAGDLRTVEGDPDLSKQVVNTQGSCSYYYGFNVRRPPFDDVNIRMAFAKSFDREAFIKDVVKIGKAADGGFIPPGFPGYDNTDKVQSFDPAAAKGLLDKAAAASKAGLADVKFTYGATAIGKTYAEWIQAQWKTNLGVEVQLDPVPSNGFSALFRKGKDSPQLFSLGWCADFPDEQNWHSTVWQTGGVSAGRTGYSSKEFDDLTKAADKEADAGKRAETYKKAGQLLSKEAPAAWLRYGAGKRVQKPWIKGIIDNPIDYGIPGYFSLEKVYIAKH